MLSSTYVQVAMQLENDHLKENLALLKSRTNDFDNTENPQQALEKLLQFAHQLHRKCCLRRVEVHFLPEMQKQVPESNALIADHELLHQSLGNLHTAICLSLYQAVKEGRDIRAEFRMLVEQYCQTMLHMLETEENTIFLLAQEAISRESWFSLARIFMREVAEDMDHHVIIDLDDYDLKNYCILSIIESDEKANSGVKYNPSDQSGLQGLELSSLHF